MNAPDITIVIPIASTDQTWMKLADDLSKIDDRLEILFATSRKPEKDIDDEIHLLRKKHDVRWLVSEPGRARQLNNGASQATREWLWFLHADSRLPKSTWEALRKQLHNPDRQNIYYFDLKFSDGGPALMWLTELGTKFRISTWGLPYGDQGFVMRHDDFAQMGGFNEKYRVGEDHHFMWHCFTNGIKITKINSPIYTSARKYKNLGWLNTTLRHNAVGMQQAWHFGWNKRLKDLLARKS